MQFQTLSQSIASFGSMLNSLVPIIIGLALVLFLIGVLGYITAGGDEERREAARNMIIFGIIALFVMVAVWGFVRILTNTFFGQNISSPPVVPGVPIYPGNPTPTFN